MRLKRGRGYLCIRMRVSGTHTRVFLGAHVHSQAAGMFVVCVGAALLGWGRVPRTQARAPLWPGCGCLQTPICKATCDPRVCMCQGPWVYISESAQMDLQVGSLVLEQLVSPGVTILLTSQNMPGPLV